MDQRAHHNWLVKVQTERSGADDGCSRTEAPRWCFCGLTERPRKCFVLVFAAFRWGFGGIFCGDGCRHQRALFLSTWFGSCRLQAAEEISAVVGENV